MEGGKRQPKRLRKGPPASPKAPPPAAKGQDGPSAQPAEAQPSSETCGICLEVTQERGVLNCCEHMFCFECILEWAKVTNRCPLCKAKFNTVTPRALKEGAEKSHKRSVYRVLDREQRVEWEPEEGELYDDDELDEEEADEDSFIVPDDEAEEEERIWRPRRAEEDDEEEEEEAVLTDDSAGAVWGDELSDGSFGTVHSLRPIHAAPPRSRRASKPPARPPPAAAAAAAAPRSPIRRYLPPAQSRAAPAPSITPLPANAPGPKPPPRPASAKQRVVDRVEIQTPDGRTLSVRRSKYSATPAPPRNADADSWSLLDRLRTGGGAAGGGAGGVTAKPEAARRPNKRRGGASSHALIAHAMPRLTFQRTASTQSPGSVAPLSRTYASAPALPPSQRPPPPPALSRSATVPAAPPSTPPHQLVRSGLSSSFGSSAAATVLVPATPQGASAQPVPAPAPPAAGAAGAASSPLAIAATPPRHTPVSSPFRGDRQERAALKHTVAERAKHVLTPIYRSNRISLVQFKVIARAATESFMREEGRGADLREHLRRAVERELGVTLESLEFKPEKTKRTD